LLKDYLTLAVPGIQINLINNGTFDTNTSGWTAYNSVLSVDTNRLKVDDTANAGAWSSAVQQVSTVIGQTYVLSLSVTTSSNSAIVGIYNGAYPSAGTAPSTTVGTYSGTSTVNYTFTATSTITSIMLVVNDNGVSFFDNVRLSTPLDYSAAIKGSGSAAICTSSGVAMATSISHYGSSIDLSSGSDWLNYSINGSYSTNDFTMECWYYPNSNPDTWGIILKHATDGSWNNGITLNSAIGSTLVFGFFVNGSGFQGPSYNNNQWYHLALERYNGIITLYVDGVATVSSSQPGNLSTVDNVKFSVGSQDGDGGYNSYGYINDIRVYKGIAKYKGGFEVPKHYTPIGISSWRAVPDTIANNFAVQQPTNGNWAQTLTDGNLTQVASSAAWNTVRSNIGIGTGKYYWEVRLAGTTNATMVGVDDNLYSITLNPSNAYVGFYTNSWSCYLSNGQIRNNTGSGSAYGSAFVQGDICMVAVDTTSGKIYWGRNGTWFNSGNPATGTNAAYSNLTGYSHLMPAISVYDTNSAVNINFGQNPTFSGTTTAGTFTDSSGKGLFKYQPPAGFIALCEDNLPTPAIADPGKHFKTVLYTGDGAAGRGIAGVGFQPDLVWIKNRDVASWNVINDSVRGANKALYSNQTYAENQTGSNPVLGSVLSFDNDGFTLAADPDANSNNGWNASGSNLVAWCWKAGGPAVTNTNGSITSQVSVNQTAGFSIVSWTGNGISTATVGHGLGKTPAFLISKARSGTNDWWVVHKSSIGNYQLNTSSGLITTGGANGSMGFPSTLTNTTFTFTAGSNSVTNVNNSTTTYVTYCWAEIEGFSKFGSYVGTGDADGAFVYCGFKPAWVLIKTTTDANGWVIVDNARNSTNPNGQSLFANQAFVEQTSLSNRETDFLSNGFKIRAGIGSERNTSGTTYIFAAFAESPFQTANAK